MSKEELPIKSLKMTAAVYATRSEVVEYVKAHGILPERIETCSFAAAFGHILHLRGVDLVLTEREQLVFDAIMRGSPLVGGMAKVIDEIDCKDDEESGD